MHPGGRRGTPATGGPDRRRRLRVVAFAAAGVALLALLTWGGLRVLRGSGAGEGPAGARGAPAPFPAPTFTAARAPAPEDFVGAEACASCHAPEHDAWARSTHGRAGGEPAPDLLLAPFDGSPIRFRDADVIPRGRDGRYEFVVRQEGQPERVFAVDGVVGGGHMLGGGTQGFLWRASDSTVRFLPFDWSPHEGSWFCNTGTRLDAGWLPVTPGMALADCGDWPPVRVLGTVDRYADCQGCHGSQIRTELVPGEGYRTRYTSLAVNCESCHGPAGRHVEMARSGSFDEGGGVGLPSLTGLDKDASLQVCFGCHALKDVLQEGWLPGAPLETHYALKFPVLGDDPYFPDGRVRTFAYQAGHLVSACYLDGPMDCVSCHEPHGQGYWDVNRRPLRDPFDDGQCTACHASKAVAPETHTFHPAGSEGSRCVSCHMPYLQHPDVGPAVRFARSDHTIPIPRPAFDRALGVADACGLCHEDVPAAELQARVEAWWGEPKPHRPLVAALLEADAATSPGDLAGRLLLPDEHDPLPQFQALARVLLEALEPDVPADPEVARRLRALAASPDPDVRALALAALHWSNGDDPSTRSFLVDALESAAQAEEALRRRWAVALGFLGDLYRDEGELARSRAGYRKALEILPEDPRLLASMGLMHNRAGDFPAAASLFRRSLAVDPDRPLTWVNLGIALGGAGDAAGAEAAYGQALARNPWEPLAHFNLGNAHLRAGRLEEALASYQGASEADPGLGRAHFYVGVILAELGRYGEALPHARRAVELEPDHDDARTMLAELEALVAGAGG